MDKTTPKEADERTRRETGGSKIRASERLAIEVDKKQQRQRQETLDQNEMEKDEKQLADRTQKIETRTRDEKKHRESYLEKRSFLDSSTKPRTEAQQQVVGGEQQAAKERQIDLTGPFRDTEITGKIKYEQSSIFHEFKKRVLGNAAPLVRATEGAKKQQTKDEKPGEKKEESLTDYVKRSFGPGSRSR